METFTTLVCHYKNISYSSSFLRSSSFLLYFESFFLFTAAAGSVEVIIMLKNCGGQGFRHFYKDPVMGHASYIMHHASLDAIIILCQKIAIFPEPDLRWTSDQSVISSLSVAVQEKTNQSALFSRLKRGSPMKFENTFSK